MTDAYEWFILDNVAATPLPEHPGWFPDPYEVDRVRWFDGSRWTLHSVSANEVNPDRVVQQHFDSRSDAEKATDDWKDQFPAWDVVTARGSEPPFDGGGGYQGYYAHLAARADVRLGSRLRGGRYGPARWCFVLAGLFALFAWADQAHRIVLVTLAGVSVIVACGMAVKVAKQQAHWKRVGRDPRQDGAR